MHTKHRLRLLRGLLQPALLHLKVLRHTTAYVTGVLGLLSYLKHPLRCCFIFVGHYIQDMRVVEKMGLI